MTPTWVSDCGTVQLYLGDCRDVLPTLGHVDAVVTDPPYGVNGKPNSKTKQRWAISFNRKKNDYGTFEDSIEYVKTVAVPIVEMALSIAKRGIITPGNRCLTLYPFPNSFGTFFQPASIGLQPWGRCDSQPILYYGAFPGKSRQIPGNNCSFTLTESPEINGHPCPKPIKAWTRLVTFASLQGETVLDPFMGSGTTGVACVRSGRRFVGIEICEKYYDIAKERIQRELNQLKLAL